MDRTILPRRVQAEWLDALSPADPRAARSRRDLARLNPLGRQARARTGLRRGFGPRPPRTVLDLGGGDGTFMLSVARRLAPEWPGVSVRLLDRHSLVTADTRSRFAALGWSLSPVQADAFVALADPDRIAADMIVANLVLHHFDQPALAILLANLAATATFVACCEPRRSVLALAGCRLLRGFGCNAVTRHDARVSVEAGFAGRELSELWSGAVGTGAGWTLDEGLCGPFTHTFTARRIGAPPVRR